VDPRNKRTQLDSPDLWLEEAEEHGLGGFVTDLRQVHDRGTRSCAMLDCILDPLQDGGAGLGVQRPEVQAILRWFASSDSRTGQRPDAVGTSGPPPASGRQGRREIGK
jgi:hypothetical protein